MLQMRSNAKIGENSHWSAFAACDPREIWIFRIKILFSEPFGLNKPEKAAETPKIVEYFPKNPKKRVEIVEKPTVDEIRELFGALMDAEGFALNQRVKPHFVLPDTRWKPTERRYIGKNWIFREKMAFFACFSRLKHEFSKVFCLFFPKMEHFSDLGVL